MNLQEAKNLIQGTFQNQFDEQRFRIFAKNLFNDIDESKTFSHQGQYIPDAYKDHVRQLKRIGKYTDPEGAELDVLVVSLKKDYALDRARTMQRNFIANYLKKRGEKDAAIVAYHTDELDDWRFSYIRMDYRAEQDENGTVRVKTDLTPARRYSFLVGKNEPNHTAQQQLLPILQDDRNNPTLAEIEKAFNIESITKEFFERYKNLFLKVKEELDDLVEKDSKIRNDFAAKSINTADFTKKLLGQIVFLYFLQKKGWLGVEKDASGNFKGWGTGPKDFLQRLHRKEIVPYNNFFNDLLEPLFYEALAVDRGEESYYSAFKCKIPFLNGGLFEPISGYNWQETDFLIRNETIGEVFATFDQYNFTVREDEPLEKEVAVDPEMLGKVFENLLEIKDRKSEGAFYTPREIVHYMCQESLINYLVDTLNATSIGYERLGKQQTELFGPNEITKPKGQMELMAKTGSAPIPRDDIEMFIRQGEFGIENDHTVEEKGRETKRYSYKLPESIRTNAQRIDDALVDIKICDPAIGSGAFPVGMLHEIVSARKTLNAYLTCIHPLIKGGKDGFERTPYNFKRHAIQQSIYGVDLDSGAVDIAKLRLWLSLVVDEDDFLSIKPLPNLDYKIVCGNSLQCIKSVLNYGLFTELESLKQDFFDEINPGQKKEEKARIDELIQQLTNNDKHFDFEIYFSEVFHTKRGFDVVIGNPPYIPSRDEMISEQDKKILYKSFDTAEYQLNTYGLFIEKGYNILKPNGIISYIIPNTWLSTKYDKKLRDFVFKKYSIRELVNVYKVFEKATVDTLVIMGQQSTSRYPKSFAVKSVSRELKSIPERLVAIENKSWGYCENYVVAAPNEDISVNFSDTMSLKGESSLSDYFVFKFGMKPYELGTGDPPQTKEMMKEKIYDSKIEHDESWLPLLKARNVKYYKLMWHGDWIKYGRNLAAPRKRDLFEGPRILIQRIISSDKISGCYTDEPFICNTDVITLSPKNNSDKNNLYWLLGIILSKLCASHLKSTNVNLDRAAFPKINVNTLESFPIPIVNDSLKAPIIERVQKILANPEGSNVPQLEAEIDRLVYELYGLTEEEIALVEGKK